MIIIVNKDCSLARFCCGGEGAWVGIEPPTKFLKRRYLKGPQLLNPPLLKVTNNLVTFKRKDRIKNFIVFGNQ